MCAVCQLYVSEGNALLKCYPSNNIWLCDSQSVLEVHCPKISWQPIMSLFVSEVECLGYFNNTQQSNHGRKVRGANLGAPVKALLIFPIHNNTWLFSGFLLLFTSVSLCHCHLVLCPHFLLSWPCLPHPKLLFGDVVIIDYIYAYSSHNIKRQRACPFNISHLVPYISFPPTTALTLSGSLIKKRKNLCIFKGEVINHSQSAFQQESITKLKIMLCALLMVDES